MSSAVPIYCLDANVLIQAWQKYYAPDICPDYWEILNKLGSQGRIFIPEEVKNKFRNAKPSKFGRVVTIIIQDGQDVEVVKTLIALKIKLK